MGKKGGHKTLPKSTSGSQSQAPISLREEATGKLQTKKSSNIKSTLKLEHLQKLAVWASNEASIKSLGSFYGQLLATTGEVMGVPRDPSSITCKRCETVLQPGFNCTVRIEKYISKARHRHRKSVYIAQKNNVVFKCHFCSHLNMNRGTPKGHMKRICSLQEKSSLESKPQKSMSHEFARLERDIMGKDEVNKIGVFAPQVAAQDIPITDNPATPSMRIFTTSLEETKIKRNVSASKKATKPLSVYAPVDVGKTLITSSKRRKSWTSLREIAQSSEQRVADLAIPFFL